MIKLSREQLAAALKTIGDDSSFRTQLRAAAKQAVLTLGVELTSEDLDEVQRQIIHKFQQVGGSSVRNNPRFNMNLLSNHDLSRVKVLTKTECIDITPPGKVESSLKFPPWGRMDEDQELLLEHWQIPRDWAIGNGANANCPQWRAWLGNVVVKISAAIWPVYVPSGITWASDAVANLTEVDFQLLAELKPYLDQPIVGASDPRLTHAVLYAEEDQVNHKFGANYERYDNTLTADDLGRLPFVLEDGFVWKVGTLHLQLKQIFQRPRPHQVAQIQGRVKYRYHVATSANSPSLVSGHCLQSALAGCHAFIELRSSMTDHSRELLKQFAVDIGDRRVFAGIHYPSDNLSSWYTALRLVPHVFAAPDVPSVMKFLWQAIEKSEVYRAITRHAEGHLHADGHSASPYVPAIKALHDLAREAGVLTSNPKVPQA